MSSLKISLQKREENRKEQSFPNTSLFTDSEDRIYVRKSSGHRLENIERTFDIFSKDGYYLYRTVCPLAPFAIKDGFFYTRVQNEDTGEVFVKRFRIKNLDKIKTGI